MNRPLADLIGDSPRIEALRDRVSRLLERQRDAHRLPPILIEGETGTGKGLLARMLHRAGPRNDGPFVDVNCAAIPETMLEAEMFGFERGAFTDARRAKPGLLQAAQRGTIFLDEIGLLSEALQAKLLKALEERTVRRLGSTRDEPIDVWLIAATNEDLRQAIRRRRFREDLYHRLAVVTLTMPPLRERGADIVRLAEHFLTRACTDYGISERRLSADARAALRDYSWPGNVRELANLMERLALLEAEGEISAAALGLPRARAAEPPPTALEGASLDDAVRDRLVEVLKRTRWNISRSAALLGISRNTLRARIEKYGLRRDAAGTPPEAAASHPSAVAPAMTAAPAPPAPPTLRWERRRVMFLKGDVVAGDDIAAHVLVRVVQTLIDKAQSFGGRLEEIRPTGIVAIFGLDPGDDAPRAAAHAAIAITRAAERARAEDAEPRFSVRVTLHLAAVNVARVGDRTSVEPDSRRDALAVIDTIASLALEEGVIVSDAGARFLGRRFELVRIGEAHAYVLGRPRERVLTDPRGRPAVFVGRERELELLRAVFDATAAGNGTVVGIAGEAGFGKSRLVAEFRERLGERPFRWLQGRCVAYGGAIPYLPIADLVREIAGVGEEDRPEHVVANLGSALATLHLNDASVIMPLWHLLGISEPNAPGLSPAPETLKSATFEAIQRLVGALSARSPLVVFIEDLQWIDSASAELLTLLAGNVSNRPILILTTYRSGYRPPWIERSYATQLALPALTQSESRRLVRALLDSDEDEIAEALLAKAEGNPFFLEELVLAWREHPAQLPGEVPDTIQAIILARIDRLSEEHRKVLQSASVIGRDVPFWLLRAVTGDTEEALRESLAALRVAEFLYDLTFGREPDHVFKHALTHEVAYGSVDDVTRRGLHRRVVGAIEERPFVQLADQTERLAHHATRAELWDKAASYWRQAGLRALSHSSHGGAVACFEHALAALQHVPGDRQRTELAIDLHFDIRSAMLALGMFANIHPHLQEAKHLAESLADQRRLGRAFAYLTDYFRQVGDHIGGLDAGQRGLALAAAHGDLGLQVATQIYLAHVYYDAGQFSAAAELLQSVVDAVTGVSDFERFGLPYIVSVHSRTWLALSFAELGEFDRALERAGEAMRIAQASEHQSSLTSAHVALGRVYLRKGDIGAATPILERGLALGRQLNMRLLLPFLTEGLGLACIYSGRVAEGLTLLREAQTLHATMRGDAGQALRLVALSQGHVIAGDTDEADRLAVAALEMARRYQELANVAYALFQRGEVARERTPRDAGTATAHFRESLTLAATLHMAPLVARCRLGLALTEGRRTEIVAALDALRALGMSLWRDQAERALATLS